MNFLPSPRIKEVLRLSYEIENTLSYYQKVFLHAPVHAHLKTRTKDGIEPQLNSMNCTG